MPRSVEVEDAAHASEKKEHWRGWRRRRTMKHGRGRRRRKTMVRENGSARGFSRMAPAY
jgi:hypothetical protein